MEEPEIELGHTQFWCPLLEKAPAKRHHLVMEGGGGCCFPNCIFLKRHHLAMEGGKAAVLLSEIF